MTDAFDAGRMPENSYIPDEDRRADRGLGRRVDRRQEAYAPSPYAAQKVLPHGSVNREGDRAVPEHSMTSRVLVYGGAAIAAAAATAGVVLAVRKVADLVSGNDELDRDADRAADKARQRVYDAGRGVPPRFAGMTEREREAMRARARARFEQDDRERARTRAEARARADRDEDHAPRRPRPAPRPARSSLGLLGDIEQSAASLSRNLNGIVGTVGAAMAAFRQVADQAEGVVREFHGTADQIRNFLGTGGTDAPRSTRPAPGRDPYRRPARRDVVDLRETGPAGVEGGRTHRL